MKKVIGCTLAWALFLVGDLVSRINDRIDPRSELLQDLCYWCYNKPMLLSNCLQDWGGAGPWKAVKSEDGE